MACIGLVVLAGPVGASDAQQPPIVVGTGALVGVSGYDYGYTGVALVVTPVVRLKFKKPFSVEASMSLHSFGVTDSFAGKVSHVAISVLYPELGFELSQTGS